MDGEHAGFGFLDSSLHRAINDLRQAVGAAATDTTRGSQLGRYLLAALEAIENRGEVLADTFRTTSDQTDRDAISREVRHLNSYVRSLHDSTAWLESLRSPTLSLGVVFFVQEASRVFMGTEPDLVLHRGAAYNYSTLGLKSALEPLLARLGGSLPDGPSPVVVIYPSLEEDRTLLHPIFLHELGHETVNREGLRDRVKSAHPDIADLDRRFNEAVAEMRHEHEARGEAISEAEAGATLRGVLDAWLEELLCDHLALAYLGPSFLFAAASFLLPTSSAEASRTHPPSSLRMSFLLAFLQELGWRPLLDERTPNVMKWLDDIASLDRTTSTDHAGAFVRQALRELVEPVQRIAIEALGDHFRPEAYAEVAEQLAQRLEHEIPPVQLETAQPAGRREILLACWLYCFGLPTLGDDPATLQGALAEVERQRFFAKTIEMSFVLEQWRVA